MSKLLNSFKEITKLFFVKLYCLIMDRSLLFFYYFFLNFENFKAREFLKSATFFLYVKPQNKIFLFFFGSIFFSFLIISFFTTVVIKLFIDLPANVILVLKFIFLANK